MSHTASETTATTAMMASCPAESAESGYMMISPRRWPLVHLSEQGAHIRRLAERPGAPFQAAAQHRVVVDDLPELLGSAFINDGHQATSS